MHPRPRQAFLGAFAAFAALALVGLVFHVWARAERFDTDLLEWTTRVRTKLHLDRLVEELIVLGDPVPYVVVALAIVVAAVVLGERRLAVLLAAVLLLAPLSAEILKVLTAEPRPHSVGFADQIAERSWPSGHTTGAMTLALCALTVAPPRWRLPVALIGLGYAAAMGFTVVALVSHFPSDALGAYLLSAGWWLLALGAAGLPQRL